MDLSCDKRTDAELLAGYAAGEEAAFREIVNRYKNGLYAFLKNFVHRQDIVDDIFQETFLQLFNSLENFDPSRPLRPWLFTIAANKAKDALRHLSRTSNITIGSISDSQEMSFEEAINNLTSDKVIPYDNLEKTETAIQVRQIISDMPENLREILILSYFNQFSYKQMAEILSIPIGTVKSRLHSGVCHFAKQWEKCIGSKARK